MAELIQVEVCYALPEQVFRIPLTIASGADIAAAIQQSGIAEKAGIRDISALPVGVFGKKKTPDSVLKDGDRIEIYRPLTADPMEARRRRAAKQNRKRGTM